MSTERDAELDAVLIGGREHRPIVIAEYDELWPTEYQKMATRIRQAVGPSALMVEHIGSTAVPGLAAKPIVDVLLVVPDVEQERSYAPHLQRVGLVLRVRELGHRMFRTPQLDFHVHVLSPGAEEIDDYLALRDWLRRSAEDREAYAAEKRELATRDWPDMNHYADAKSEVVQSILKRARQWQAKRGVGGG